MAIFPDIHAMACFHCHGWVVAIALGFHQERREVLNRKILGISEKRRWET
jgi:hypothetical protein